MPVLKNKIEKNFVVVPRAFLMDRTLRLKERGLVATLLSLPDNWNFTVKGLATITGDGKES
ncbi:MAG: helix-turn-helix domain-containing protein, partial [Lachnospiraceae bacterium]|nr:helix-turn-helix domain-containing protein [Lachnospiraceae bacterium]